jgi:hypothetical protein
MISQLNPALTSASVGESKAKALLDMVERGAQKLERQARARRAAMAEMRKAMQAKPARVNTAKFNAPKNKDTRRRQRQKPRGRDLTGAETDHAMRLISEGYALSKIAWMLDVTQLAVIRATKARREMEGVGA